ncbi:hypothetical protein Mgra_00003294 [Meloidogyne graminicola]|uniref:EGF-like domain-containing protein n=1 Tax=Meloidogyne graminicola TaxID=189291 RepID=A0A8S9ZUW6_9BILA|nr:hypothetical protein Mgra_00003294 [Meloidogyne graminicola]
MFIILFQRIKKRPFLLLLFFSSNLFSFYLFLFILICKLINLINSSGQLLFQLTTFNISEQIKIELCANEFRWPSKNEWGKDCKFGKAEIYLIATTTTTKTLIQTTTKTTSISLPFTHYWRQSFTLEFRLWHNNVDNNVLNPTDNCYCINGGKCVDNKCLCPTGYWGNNCEKCIPSSRCKGFCRQRPGECSCPEGKGGQFCEKDLIFCSKNSPCQNGGICQNNPEGNYTCKCTPGYGGKNCEKRLTNCEEEPCYNGAKCVPLSSSEFRCLCSPFNFGRFCEVKALNGCRDLPCKNNGTCINLSTKNIQQNSFKCLCSEEWTGHICEYKNNCLNKPCLNDGTCINSMNSFQCFCTENWEGQYCQNKIWKNKKQLNER